MGHLFSLFCYCIKCCNRLLVRIKICHVRINYLSYIHGTNKYIKMSSNDHTSSVMLLLKQRASNVDQLLKKQKKLEKSAKDMKLEIKRLKEEILIKDQMIQQIRETPDQTPQKDYEKEAFIEENKTMQEMLK